METRRTAARNVKWKIKRQIVWAAAAVLTFASAAPARAAILDNGDLYIPIAEVTEKAVFYPMNIEGTEMEAFAVKAPDGTIRTALNTCQICYGSGRAYYEQQGDIFVCQNCGNPFNASQIEIIRGGCNPVPIPAKYKTADEKGITIPRDFLVRAKIIFRNWKR
ncbi:MAG: DUF2318 domain-containing protein [Synergistaceae bacterium]|nr:DUF2318 domain-containing protein [Synergistaceae bacterium]